MSLSTRLPLGRSFVVVAAALVAASCDSTTSPTSLTESPVLTTVTTLWVSDTDAYTSSDVRSLPAVIVRDQFGRAMSGVRVSFAVTAGGGTVQVPDVITSSDGVARLKGWTLGPMPGENIVVATVGSFTVSFRLVSKAAGDPCLGCWDY